MSSPAPYADALDPTRITSYPFLRQASGASTPINGRSASDYGKPREPEGGRTQVYVGNLPYRVRWQDLKDLFRNAGAHHLNILRADVSLLPDNRSKGTGTVLFATREDALRAVESYNGFNWQGRSLDVHLDTQDPTGAIAIAQAAMAQSQPPQMIGIPMMHFMPPGASSNWPSPAPRPASLPDKAQSMTSTSPPPSSSRPGSSLGHHRAGTPATSPGEQNTPTSNADTAASITVTTASGQTIQIPTANFPQGMAMVPIMLPPGANPAQAAQMFAMPQYGFGPNGGLVYYPAQAFRPSPGIAPGQQNRHLFVGNLPFNCQWQDLKDLFRSAGNILRADITTGPDGRSRGFGTVLFASTEDAHNAVNMFNGYEYNGRQLKVHFDKFAGQQHPAAGLNGQPPLQHRSSAPVLPSSGMAPSIQQSMSGSFLPSMNGFGEAMERDGSHQSAIPVNSEANKAIHRGQERAGHALPSVHGAIHPPHAMAYSASAEPTQVLGPSALMSPGPAQTGEMHAFAAAAGMYGDHHRFPSLHAFPMHASHLRQSTTAEEAQYEAEEHEEGEQQQQYAHFATGQEAMKTPDEHPGPLHVQIPPAPFFGPLSPEQSRGVQMTPSMPGFSFHPFPQTPPLMPHFLSPGLGPFSPPLGHTPQAAYAAPGVPMHYGMGTPTSATAPGSYPGYFPSMGAVVAPHIAEEAEHDGQITSSASSDTDGTVVEAPVQESLVSPPGTAKSNESKSLLGIEAFRDSALAARRASSHSVRKADGSLALLPSALDATSPVLNATSPSAGPKTDGSDDLSSKVSRLDIGPSADEAGPARRASFLDSGFPGSAAAADLRRRIDEEEANNAPRRSSFDGGTAVNQAKLKRFGHTIWQYCLYRDGQLSTGKGLCDWRFFNSQCIEYNARLLLPTSDTSSALCDSDNDLEVTLGISREQLRGDAELSGAS